MKEREEKNMNEEKNINEDKNKDEEKKKRCEIKKYWRRTWSLRNQSMNKTKGVKRRRRI